MKYANYIIWFIVFLVIGCVAPQSSFTVSPNKNINGYRHVMVMPLKYENGIVDTYGLAIKVKDELRKSGFNIVEANSLKNLPESQKTEVLICEITHWHTPAAGGSAANVQITMFDVEAETVYSGKGVFQGLSIQQDLLGAADQALLGLKKKYSGFNAAFKIQKENKFDDWEIIDHDINSIKTYVDRNDSGLDPIEGIWTTIDGAYKIGVVRDSSSTSRDFVGFIIESDRSQWAPKQVKIEFNRTALNNTYSTIYYMGNHDKSGTVAFLESNSILKMEVKPTVGDPLDVSFIKNYPLENISRGSNSRLGIGEINSSSQGSGFVISKMGHVVTNYHVISDKSAITVYFPSTDLTVTAEVALKDKNNDIAILKIRDFNLSDFSEDKIPYAIQTSDGVNLGQDVFTLGFPLGNILGRKAKLSTGVINSVYGIQDDPRLFQISNPIQPGNSGGPLFSTEGNVIGIVVASLNAKYFYENVSIIPQNVNFAIKGNYLLNLLSMLLEDSELPTNQQNIDEPNLEEQIERITPFIVTVIGK